MNQILHVPIKLYKQTHLTLHHYAIKPNTLYIPPQSYTNKNTAHVNIMYTTKHTVHVTIMLYLQSHCKHQPYDIPQKKLYTSKLCNTTNQTVHFTTIIFKQTHST